MSYPAPITDPCAAPGCVPGLPEGLCAQQGLFLPHPLGCLRTALLLCLAHGHAWCCDIETPDTGAVIRPCGGRFGRGVMSVSGLWGRAQGSCLPTGPQQAAL